MALRDRPEWFTTASEPVLELLAESPFAMNRTTIVYNIQQELSDPPGSSSIYNCIPALVEHGLVDRDDEGANSAMFRITDRGIAYLEGELSSDDLE